MNKGNTDNHVSRRRSKRNDLKTDSEGNSDNEKVVSGGKRRKRSETPVSKLNSQEARGVDLDVDLPPHSSKATVIPTRDGKGTNITFEEDNNYADMVVAGGDNITDHSESGEGVASSSDESEIGMKTSFEQSSQDQSATQSSAKPSSDEAQDSESPPKKKKRSKIEKRKLKKKKSQEQALEKMRNYMIQRGLINSDMSEGEIDEMMDADLSSVSGSEDEVKIKKKKKLKHRNRAGDRGKKLNRDVIINSPSETTIYREVVNFERAKHDAQERSQLDMSDDPAAETSGNQEHNDQTNNVNSIEYIPDRS